MVGRANSIGNHGDFYDIAELGKCVITECGSDATKVHVIYITEEK